MNYVLKNDVAFSKHPYVDEIFIFDYVHEKNKDCHIIALYEKIGDNTYWHNKKTYICPDEYFSVVFPYTFYDYQHNKLKLKKVETKYLKSDEEAEKYAKANDYYYINN